MKLFIQKGFHLRTLSTPTRLVYTLFLVFIALGTWSSMVMYADRLGGDLRGPPGKPSVEERYVNRPAPASAGGPALELDDAPAAAAAPAVVEDLKRPWVLDVFHQHTFSVSVVFLILAHLFVLTRLHPAISGSVVLVAGVSSLAHVLAPVIIWKTGAWLWLMPVSGAAMGISWTVMILWSLFAMWLGKPGARESA